MVTECSGGSFASSSSSGRCVLGGRENVTDRLGASLRRAKYDWDCRFKCLVNCLRNVKYKMADKTPKRIVIPTTEPAINSGCSLVDCLIMVKRLVIVLSNK